MLTIGNYLFLILLLALTVRLLQMTFTGKMSR
jgi:hypothetical protein